ncbi:MAG: MmgE/PrpD family protein [Pseudomonadota bacterium]
MSDPMEFLRAFHLSQAPDAARHQADRLCLDLIGVAAGGATTRLSHLIRDHAAAVMPGTAPLAFDGRGVSSLGQALALGMTIDALDGHDGYNPAKGHVGCGLIAGMLALWPEAADQGGAAFAEALILGYELGSRLATSLHASVSDYHTSGAWVAVTVAAVGSRMLALSEAETAHALGIAEYHGPRSQMMRCIDHPTMLKDGSGWGAMCGVSAVLLARSGFTGAPALTFGAPGDHWTGLGTDWRILQQYLKPYPVCRWAQAPVEAVLALRTRHGLTAGDVAAIEIESFHEATRLATNAPANTEEAQYSTSFPAAVAMVRGAIGAADVQEGALDDPEVRRLSLATTMREHDHANANFPSGRLARVALTLTDGRRVESDWASPRWDAETPPTDAELEEKFRSLASVALGSEQSASLRAAVAAATRDGPAELLSVLGDPLVADERGKDRAEVVEMPQERVGLQL